MDHIVDGKFTQDKGSNGNNRNSDNAIRQREYTASKLSDKVMSRLEHIIVLTDLALYGDIPGSRKIKTPWKKRNVFDRLCAI